MSATKPCCLDSGEGVLKVSMDATSAFAEWAAQLSAENARLRDALTAIVAAKRAGSGSLLREAQRAEQLLESLVGGGA